MKDNYEQIDGAEIQKCHPFGLAEKRFSWVNKYNNGNDLKNHKKLFKKKKDNLEGGLGRFFSRIKLEETKEKEREKNLLEHTLNLKKRNKMKYKYQNINSQRVIFPEKNTEKNKTIKKKTYEKLNKSLLYHTNGSLSSFTVKLALFL